MAGGQEPVGHFCQGHFCQDVKHICEDSKEMPSKDLAEPFVQLRLQESAKADRGSELC